MEANLCLLFLSRTEEKKSVIGGGGGNQSELNNAEYVVAMCLVGITGCACI